MTYDSRRTHSVHLHIADLLREEPTLIEKARQTYARLMAQPTQDPMLQEWGDVLNAGVEACLEVLTEESGWADAMRDVSPLDELITEEQRLALLRRYDEYQAEFQQEQERRSQEIGDPGFYYR